MRSRVGRKACGKSLGGEVVALDGKSVRRALNRGEDFRVIVSAWATESGLLLGQRKVRDKSNEITVVPELLQALELAGCIVTADAMHCNAPFGCQSPAQGQEVQAQRQRKTHARRH